MVFIISVFIYFLSIISDNKYQHCMQVMFLFYFKMYTIYNLIQSRLYITFKK